MLKRGNEMRVGVIGTGYVGLVTGACLADFGRQVICCDINELKISELKKGIIPIYEPGLEELVKNNEDRLTFTTNIEPTVKNSDIIFIAVGTPMGEDGSADLKYVLAVAESIGKAMDHEIIVVDKSTVPVGTADKVRAIIEANSNGIPFHVVSNPEFLKEGSAIGDFSRPDRIVVGVDDDIAQEAMRDLYLPLVRDNPSKLIFMDVKSAEMTKYAANSLLATKISFMNEIANICERVGANVNMVRKGIGSDTRIGSKFLYAGCGYGGSCFPKDVRALIKTAKDHGYSPKIIEATEAVNFEQKRVMVKKIVSRFGEDLTGITIGVWGLAFKPNTDDMREAPSITIIKALLSKGAKIKAYDPKALGEATNCYLRGYPVEYGFDKYQVINGADALLLLTEWKEFQLPDFLIIKQRLAKPIIFDGRNQYSDCELEKKGFEYYQIGVKHE